jgi:hypothetical protein
MIEIEAPDGTIVEFPAGTSRDVMRDAMRRRFGVQQQEQPLPMPPPPTPEPIGAGGRFMQGLGDVVQGGAQALVNTLPTGVVDTVNSGAAWLNRQPGIGPLTQAMGITPATPADLNRRIVERENEYDARRFAGGGNPTSFDPMRLAGQVTSQLPVALAVAPATLPGAVAGGVATGAAIGAATPVPTEDPTAYGDALMANTTMGGMLGAAGGAAGNLIGRAIAPRVTPELRALDDAGVRLTPGQMAGGPLRRLEDAATSIPGVGAPILDAQRRGVESSNRAIANAVLRPIGATVPDDVPAGRPLAAFTQQAVSDAYETGVRAVQPFVPDQPFQQALSAIPQNNFLTPGGQREFQSFLRENILPRIQATGGVLDGSAYKEIVSVINDETRRLARAQATGTGQRTQRELSAALREVRTAFDDLLERTNPQAAQQIFAADEAFAQLTRMTQAQAGPGAVDGVFTPAQFQQAVRQQDTSTRRSAMARGDALLQPLSDPMRAVLPSSVPNSGTTDRALASALLLGGPAAAAAGLVSPGTLAAYLGSRALYSDPGSQLVQRMVMAPRGPTAQAAGTALRGSGAGVAVPLGSMLLAPPPPPSGNQRR